METLSASAVPILWIMLYHLWLRAVTLDQNPCLLSFVPLLPSSFLGMFFFFFTPSLHLLHSQTACLAGVLCSKLVPTLYPVIIIVPSAEDVKINRSGESGGDWGRRRRTAWWLTIGLLSAATSLQRREIRNLHEEEMEDSDDKERCGLLKAVLYYWCKFRMETDQNEGKGNKIWDVEEK